MSSESHELLRRYVVERSEPAFAALVQRHLDLVYSAALRQLGGDPHAARDVTQAVFCDLARQAPRLLRHPALAAWLYTATRYRATRLRRAEQRRRHRELQAHAMNAPLQAAEPDPAWQELRPVLDDAMHALNATDREALLLRFFENRPLAEVGARLGLSENAARMRVERALGKLRAWLARRGVTTPATALAVCLSRHAVNAAPPELAGRVTRAALAAGATGGGFLAGVQALWVTAKAPVLAGGAAVLVLVAGLWLWEQRPAAEVPGVSAVETSPAAADTSSTGTAEASPAGTSPAASVAADPDAGVPLRLEVVTADTGKPVPNVRFESWLWEGETVSGNTLWADRFGRCAVPVPRDSTTELVLVSQCEGFADTRLAWRPDLGETIPERYTLRVARAVPLGGYVVDADGQPVAGAEVSFSNNPPRAEETRPQTDNFGWKFSVTTTDAEGRWRIERIGEAALRTLTGQASHPEHLPSEWVKGQDSEALKQLREGTYVFRLGRAVTVRGLVVDPAGRPVPGAKVHVGMLGHFLWRETTTATEGTFEVTGCVPGRNLLSAEASGFAPTSQEVELTADAGPFRLTLGPGRLLRLRVVDTHGAPVPQANVWLNNPQRHMGLSAEGGLPVVANFHRQTDAEGRMEWENAPDQEQSFDIQAKGYLRAYDVKLRANGTEHVVVLQPALTIAGTVRDAASGEPVPRFRIIAGRPLADEAAGNTNVNWSSIDRFRLEFAGGQFRHVFEEPVSVGDEEPAFVFKFEAVGYAPFVSRVVRASEGLAQFEVRLRAARARTVTVGLPDGRPAVNADIGLIVPGNPLTLIPGGCERDPLYAGSRLLTTDGRGQFHLPPDGTITQVVAAHPQGFAVVAVSALSSEPVVRLQPWGRLEGTWRSGDQPVAGRELALDQWVMYEAGLKLNSKAYQVKTDREGRFVFPRCRPASTG